MSLSPITLNPGNNRTQINEEELYNPDGIEIHYGYDGKAVYGYLDESGAEAEEFPYSALAQTPGLHNINLSRPLEPGEEITLHWRNNYDLIIFCDENGITKVKKPIGGTYQEIGKWADDSGYSENTCPKFDDDILTKRFDYIETKVFKEF